MQLTEIQNDKVCDIIKETMYNQADKNGTKLDLQGTIESIQSLCLKIQKDEIRDCAFHLDRLCMCWWEDLGNPNEVAEAFLSYTKEELIILYNEWMKCN